MLSKLNLKLLYIYIKVYKKYLKKLIDKYNFK